MLFQRSPSCRVDASPASPSAAIVLDLDLQIGSIKPWPPSIRERSFAKLESRLQQHGLGKRMATLKRRIREATSDSINA
jgi:hypothetical protein